jgi:hypothetical protein
MPTSLDDLRSQFSGYKANRFKIVGELPPGLVEVTNFKLSEIEFYVKAAQVPGSFIGYVPLNYRGRNIKFPTERSFSDWGMQIYPSSENPQDLRGLFATWIQELNSGLHNKMNYELVARKWKIYFNDITNQSSSPMNYKNSVTMWNCFPIEISPMEMNNDSPDTFAEFTVTMAFDYTEESVDNLISPLQISDSTNFTIA